MSNVNESKLLSTLKLRVTLSIIFESISDNTTTRLWHNISGGAQSTPRANSQGEILTVISEFQPVCDWNSVDSQHKLSKSRITKGKYVTGEVERNSKDFVKMEERLEVRGRSGETLWEVNSDQHFFIHSLTSEENVPIIQSCAVVNSTCFCVSHSEAKPLSCTIHQTANDLFLSSDRLANKALTSICFTCFI